jgi:hypothetical protein
VPPLAVFSQVESWMRFLCGATAWLRFDFPLDCLDGRKDGIPTRSLWLYENSAGQWVMSHPQLHRSTGQLLPDPSGSARADRFY